MSITSNLSLLASIGTMDRIGRFSTNIFDLEVAKHCFSKSQRAPSINSPLI